MSRRRAVRDLCTGAALLASIGPAWAGSGDVKMGGFGGLAGKAATPAAQPKAGTGLTSGSARKIAMKGFGGLSKTNPPPAPERAAPPAAVPPPRQEPDELDVRIGEARLRAGQLEQSARVYDRQAQEAVSAADAARAAAELKRAELEQQEGAFAAATRPKGKMQALLRKIVDKIEKRLGTTRFSKARRAREATLRQPVETIRAEYVASRMTAGEVHERATVAQERAAAARREWAQAHQQVVELGIRPAAKARAVEQAVAFGEGRASYAQMIEARVAGSDPRREAGLAEANQHLLNVRGEARLRYQRAAQRWGLRGIVESKPGEGSQDAFAAAPEQGVFALSDGVSNSDFPGTFSRALVRGFAARPPAEGQLEAWVDQARGEWKDSVAPRLRGARQPEGSATFLGVQVVHGAGGGKQLRVVGVGDSALFLVRGGELAGAFPYTTASEFSGQTHALKTAGAISSHLVDSRIDAQAGDEAFMLTDALAKWAMERVEKGEDPFTVLRGLQTKQQMKAFVTRERARVGAGNLDVDDSSLVRFVVPAE